MKRPAGRRARSRRRSRRPSGWRRCAARGTRPGVRRRPRRPGRAASTAITASCRTSRPARPATTTSSSARATPSSWSSIRATAITTPARSTARCSRGEPFDSAWGWSVNDALSDAALRAAVLAARWRRRPARRRGADADVALVRHVLARLRRALPDAAARAAAPIPGPYRGVACWSALDESVWIIRLAWAAALIARRLSGRRGGASRAGLLRAGARAPRAGSATGRSRTSATGTTRRDPDARRCCSATRPPSTSCLDGEYGVRDQLTRGVGGRRAVVGGLAVATTSTSWAALVVDDPRACARPAAHSSSEDVVRRMFRAPLDLAFPDGVAAGHERLLVPHRPDRRGRPRHPERRRVLRDGVRLVRRPDVRLGGRPEPAVRPAAGRWRRCSTGRRVRAACDAPAPRRRSRLLEPTGLAMLRAGGAEVRRRRSRVILKARPATATRTAIRTSSGSRCSARGRRLAIDPGTPGYGIALNDTWYRQTASHSTVLLNSRARSRRRRPGTVRVQSAGRWSVRCRRPRYRGPSSGIGRRSCSEHRRAPGPTARAVLCRCSNAPLAGAHGRVCHRRVRGRGAGSPERSTGCGTSAARILGPVRGRARGAIGGAAATTRRATSGGSLVAAGEPLTWALRRRSRRCVARAGGRGGAPAGLRARQSGRGPPRSAGQAAGGRHVDVRYRHRTGRTGAPGSARDVAIGRRGVVHGHLSRRRYRALGDRREWRPRHCEPVRWTPTDPDHEETRPMTVERAPNVCPGRRFDDRDEHERQDPRQR